MGNHPLIYQFDNVRVEPGSFQVFKAGTVLPLEPKAFEVLIFLIEHRGRLIEKEELLNAVWKDAFVTQNAMTRVIAHLRKALGEDAKEARYIETVPTRGYRFIAEVEVATDAGRREPGETIREAPLAEEGDSAARMATESPSVHHLLAAKEAKVRQGFQRLLSPKMLALAGAFGAVLIAGALGWKLLTRPRVSGSTGASSAAQITSSLGLDFYPALSPDGNSIAYSSDRSGNFELYVKPLTPGGREIQITSDGAQNFEPAWSPDGRRIAYYSKNRGGIWVMPALGGAARQLIELGSRPAWSRDGSFIAFQSDGLADLGATSWGVGPSSTIWIVPAKGGSATQITQVSNPPGAHGSPSWSPDGKRIVFGTYESNAMSEIWTVSVRERELKRLTRNQQLYYDPTYSPDGQYIYYAVVSGSSNFGLWKFRISTDSGEPVGEPAQVVNTTPTRIKHLTLAADGKKLAYAAVSMVSNLWSVPVSPGSSEATGTALPLTQDTSYRNSIPAFSPDGSKIAFVSWRSGTNQNIWLIDADGRSPAPLTTDAAGDPFCCNIYPSWFPAGDQIAFFSLHGEHPVLRSVVLRSGGIQPLIDLDQSIEVPRMSADGKQIAFNSRKGGTVNVWTVPIGGGAPKQLSFDRESMGYPCWSPDGKFLAIETKRGDDTHIVILPSSGGASTQLTFERGQSWPYDWSPDGDKIVFAGFRHGYWNIWWVSRSTKAQKQVTNYSKLNSYVRYPAWSPLGNQIVYEYAETTANIWVMELK